MPCATEKNDKERCYVAVFTSIPFNHSSVSTHHCTFLPPVSPYLLTYCLPLPQLKAAVISSRVPLQMAG